MLKKCLFNIKALYVAHECIWILGLMIQAWLLDCLFMLSVRLKPEHLESLFTTDLYEVQGGDVGGLKALIAHSPGSCILCWKWLDLETSVVQQADAGCLCVG